MSSPSKDPGSSDHCFNILMSKGYDHQDAEMMSMYLMETKPRSPSLLPSPLPESLAGTKLNITDHTFTDQTPPQSIQKECKAKRKLNFDDQVSPCRGQRSIKSKQRRRQRYRNKKKAIVAAQKRDSLNLFENNLCKRWKKREEFSQQIEGLETAEKGMNMFLQNKLMQERQEAKRIAEEKEKIDRCTVHKKYDELLANSLQSVTQPLLLPEVFASTEKNVITMDKNQREQLVEDMRIELHDALYQAKTYRNLAERLQKKKRKVCYQMEEKMETVTHFWRNIKEGSSRAAKILRCAVQKEPTA